MNKRKDDPNFSVRKKFAAFDIFSPKRIIMEQIKERLSGTGVTKIVLVFSVDNDNYKVMVSNEKNEALKLDITQDEMTTLKKVFIKRIVNSWKLKYDEEPKDVIIQVDVVNSMLELFIQTYKPGEVLKFDY